MTNSRRSFLGIAAGSLWSLAKGASVYNGVTIGVQGYSFRDRTLDQAIDAAKLLGISCYELYQGHVEPKNVSRQQLREWRIGAAQDDFRAIRRKFDAAGIELWSCGYNFREDFTDEEIEHGFIMAKALGVKRMNASANVSVVKRLDPYAMKYGISVGLHNHANLKANEFATPENFEEALRGRSKFMAINFDIGHFTAAGFDAVKFIEQHHARILTIHLKDRKTAQGANVAFGEGNTPIKEVLQLLKKGKYGIPALIEYEYKGADTVEEVRRCLDYCRRCLA